MKELKIKDFDWLQIQLASPEKIEEWSYGEVKKSETINYRTNKNERDGLFDERIFGPEKDYECYCGKYKGVRYKGMVCEKCGVEITKSIVRRRRMGHVELAAPVAHIWFLRSMPSRISLILGISPQDTEKVVYFAGYIITSINEKKRKEYIKLLDEEYKKKVESLDDEESIEKVKNIFLRVKKDLETLKKYSVIDELVHSKYKQKFPDLYEAEIGAEAIYELIKKINLKKLETELEKEMENAGAVEKKKIEKRFNLVKSMVKSGVKPEWMFFTKLPVIPPALRPIVSLGAGRHASSDANDLYRRIINRNNRLKKLIGINAPDVILRNEKRILQEAVDALIDNSMRRSTSSAAMSAAQRRPLKSLSEAVKGKQGIFRANLLGKRVDYSGRSVIVVGPELKVDEVGLPKHMALELFKPFVASKLLLNGDAFNIRSANRLIDEGKEIVWEYLEEVIKNKFVLLNRAPTLHKLGILAFKPLLTEGMSIRLHPLVCAGFNADFDGDTMSVHLPISAEAQKEAAEIMSAAKNIIKPGNNEIIVNSRLDIILGTYWATKIIPGAKGEGKAFQSPNDAIAAYEHGAIDFRAKISVMGTENLKYKEYAGKVFETTAGRLLFNAKLPADYPFLNEMMDKKAIAKLEKDLIAVYGLDGIPEILDSIKEFGFKYATVSGTTWSSDDVIVPNTKEKIIKDAEKKVKQIMDAFNEGLITKEERVKKNVEIWFEAKAAIDEEISKFMVENDSVSDMIDSGSRGSKGNMSAMAGMKGIVSNVLNEPIEFPVKSSIKEGLEPIEYFITTHGSRKGLADTALNTAKAGYLTRRLFDAGQDVIIKEEDCGTKNSILISTKGEGFSLPFVKTAKGRYVAETIKDKKGEIIFKKGHFLTHLDTAKLDELGIEEIKVRSPMTCETEGGLCQKCYGMDMGGDQLVDLGEPVGTIAAQAIGEPGTQLTMRTFHSAGAASKEGDITMGLPRVEEIFERRKPKIPAIISRTDGEVIKIEKEGQKTLLTIHSPKEAKKEKVYVIPYLRELVVKEGDKVSKGDFLTDGHADISELLKYAGPDKTKEYIISETVKIYELQGSSVARKHIEVIISQMFSMSKVLNPGDSDVIEGSILQNSEITKINDKLKAEKKEPMETELLVLGIAEVSLHRKSWLSSVSFQHSVRMLINASLEGRIDELEGLKENVIIGALIPAGSGFEGSKKYEMIRELQEKLIAENEEIEEVKEQIEEEESME